jgi:hypothetical protein
VFRRVDADGNLLLEGTDVHGGLLRRLDRFPEVRQGWYWLAGMVKRRTDGGPPLTVAEFEKLACWFVANFDRLTALARPSCLLEVGKGRKDSVINLRCQATKARGHGTPESWRSSSANSGHATATGKPGHGKASASGAARVRWLTGNTSTATQRPR